MRKFFLAFFLILITSEANAQATTMCAPISGFSAQARQVNAPSGNNYQLDSRGCTSVTSLADINFFVASGFTVGGGGGTGGGGNPDIPGSFAPGQYGLVGAVGDGIADDTIPMQNAMAACETGGGGSVVLGSGRYLINSGDITVPRGCKVMCYAPLSTSGRVPGLQDMTSIRFAVLLNPQYHIYLLNSGGWEGCPVLTPAVAALNQALPAHNTYRYAANLRDGYSSTGLTLGKGPGFNANDVTIKDTLIVGFDWCIAPGGEPVYDHSVNSYTNNTISNTNYIPAAAAATTNRLKVSHVFGDCTNGLWVDQAHDVVTLDTINFHPLITSNNVNVSRPRAAISGVAASPNVPLVRVTTSADLTDAQTGEWLYITASISGAASIQNRWKVNVIDTKTFDLQGSDAAYLSTGSGVTFNATMVAGQNTITQVNSSTVMNFIGGNSVITSAFLSSPVHVVTWVPRQSAIVTDLSQTYTARNVPFTIQDEAWSANGATAQLDSAARRGVAYYMTNSEGIFCWNCNSYGYDISFWAGQNMYGFQCSLCETDGSSAGTGDPNTISILDESRGSGQNQSTQFHGGWMISHAQSLIHKANSGGQPSVYQGVLMQQNGAKIANVQLLDGAIVFTGNNIGIESNPAVFLGNTLDRSTIYGNNMNNFFYFEDLGTPVQKRMALNFTADQKSAYQGPFLHSGRTTLGANPNWIGNDSLSPVTLLTPGCRDSVGNCATAFLGYQIDQTFVTRMMSEGGTVIIPEQVQSAYLTDGSLGQAAALSQITINLPQGAPYQGVEPGQKLDIFFNQGVQNINWGGLLNHGAPDTVAPNTWVKCQVTPFNEKTDWMCASTQPACPVRFERGGGAASDVKQLRRDDCILNIARNATTATRLGSGYVPWAGQKVTVKDAKGDAGTNNITLTLSHTIDGSASKVLSQNYDSITIVFNGAEWNEIMGRH